MTPERLLYIMTSTHDTMSFVPELLREIERLKAELALEQSRRSEDLADKDKIEDELEQVRRELAEKSEQVQLAEEREQQLLADAEIAEWVCAKKLKELESADARLTEQLTEAQSEAAQVEPLENENVRLREALTDARNTYHYDTGHSGSVDDCRRGQCEEMYEALHHSPSKPEDV